MKKTKFALIGLAAGFLNGLFGAGGGMVAVPALKGFGLSQKEAHATSLAVILPISVVSAVLYVQTGKVRVEDALPFMPWGVAGAVAGGLLLKKAPDKWLRRLFAAFTLWAGVRLLLG